MDRDQQSKARLGWPVDAEMCVHSTDFFTHKGELHTSEAKCFFFKNEKEMQDWIVQNSVRASEDGPLEIRMHITDWVHSKRPHKRVLERIEVKNPDMKLACINRKFVSVKTNQD